MKKQLAIILIAACALTSQISATPFFEFVKNLKNSTIQNEHKPKDINNTKFVITDEYNGEFFTATFNHEPDAATFNLSEISLHDLNNAMGIPDGDTISFPKEGKIIFDLTDQSFLTAIKHHSTQEIYTAAISKILQYEVDNKEACEKIDYRIYPSPDEQGNQIIDCLYILEEEDDDYDFVHPCDHFSDDDYYYDDYDDSDYSEDDCSEYDLISIFVKIIITNDNAYFLIVSTPDLSNDEKLKVQDFFSSFKTLEIQ